MKKTSRFIAFILLIFLLQGCNNREKESWITENTCELPCWNEVIVGATTKTEFLQIISRLSIINQNKTIPDGESWTFFSERSFFIYKDLKIHGVAFYIEEIPEELTFSGELRTTFGDIVSSVGYPDYLIVIPMLYPTTSLDVTAIYPTLGIAFSYNTRTIPKNMRDEIGPDIPIDYVTIFDPMIYDELVEASLFGQSFLSGEETRESLRPWNGYGVLLEKYPPARKK